MLRWLLTVGIVAGQGFERDLQPVLRRHCYACHAAGVRMGSLDVETHEGLMRGGNQGPIVVPGNAAESRLYLTLTGAMEPFMPMGGKRLSPSELAIVKRWIDTGARPDPGGLVWRGRVLAVGWGGDVRILDESGTLIRKLSAHVGTVRGVWLSPDGQLVGAQGSAIARVYEVATGKESAPEDMEFQTAGVALSPDGRRRAVLQEDGSVRFYEHE
jgi:WD40 repeat protein